MPRNIPQKKRTLNRTSRTGTISSKIGVGS